MNCQHTFSTSQTLKIMLPLPQATLGGEGWGEGAACRVSKALRFCRTFPPHPTLSPIENDGGEGLKRRSARQERKHAQ